MRRRVCLDLFSGLGGFSAAFRESDEWEVFAVDLDPDDRFDPDLTADVMDLRPADLPDADVMLIGFPCTYMSPARNITEGGDPAWDGDSPASDAARGNIALLWHTHGLIQAIDADYWFLENPIGRLRTIYGQPTATVTQCQYGRETQKPTDLWGRHPPMTYRRCSPGDDCHAETGSYTPDEPQPRLGTLGESDDRAERSLIPYDLSLAIREAVEDAYANPPPVQATFDEIGSRVRPDASG